MVPRNKCQRRDLETLNVIWTMSVQQQVEDAYM